ncbi:uncharacterized protein LOC134260684 [Saccostrea cucullata]|uniref:uncharacterized protein LOC134260684 n=1 Tax=Saccostrea cuccullata TaxID=36930 RepID=UPI002ED0C893
MAASKPQYPLGSPKEHIKMCKTHDLPIDVICEDCDEFICGKCAKADHKEHEWSTIPTAASQRRRGLLNFLRKIRKEDLPGIDEKMCKVSKKITENKELCDSDIKKVQSHIDEIITRLLDMTKRNVQRLKDNLKANNDKLESVKSELDKEKKKIAESVEFMEDNKIRYNRGKISDVVLGSLIGKTLDLDYINLTETSSFKKGEQRIFLLRALICLYSRQNRATDTSRNQSVDGGLLVTLRDNESDLFKLESHSRRLVRHITVTGDVIHEYGYQEDGQTRLFTCPARVTQNSNSDICVVNRTSLTTGELVIVSVSGRMKSVYRGQNMTKNFFPTDVVCDSLCNILVTDRASKNIHLLSPVGEFLKFLLSGREVNGPARLSLYKSTLWVGYYDGLVKVFQY